MPGPRTRFPTRAPRSGLMIGCAAGALAFAAAPQSVSAQAFQAESVTVSGTVFRQLTSDTTETISIETPTAIVDWFPNDGQSAIVDFLPQGNVATFSNGENVTDFAILNRIIPQAPGQQIAFNGTVISELQTQSGTVRGGTVAFYTPNGLIVGADAVFDVGRLVLTTAEPLDWDAFANGASTRFSVVNPGSRIEIQPGAQINALEEGAYLAMLAPRIEMAGNVRVNGSIAYVAADQVDLAINDGLFDILVALGTEDANGVVHSGSTGGPASLGTDDLHRTHIYALPKNEAITMLLSGSIGYDAAQNVAVENGEIWLQAGPGLFADEPGAELQSNLIVSDASVTSQVQAVVMGDLVLDSGPGGLSFDQDVLLFGRSSVSIDAQPGATISFGERLRAASYSNETGEAGTIRLSAAAGGAIEVAGATELRTDRFALFDSPPGAPLIPAGGTIELTASGGTMAFGADVILAAGGNGDDGGAEGQASTGGDIAVTATQGGTMTFAANLTAVATGSAGRSGATGLDGSGGQISFLADGGALSVDGILYAESRGFSAGGPQVASGGNGSGGAIDIQAANDGVVSARSAIANADGFGGAATAEGGIGGTGTGGLAQFTAASGGRIEAGQITGSAIGNGGLASLTGGDGQGGSARLAASAGGSVSAGAIALLADGFGASGGNGNVGAGGNGTGGLASIELDAGDVRLEAARASSPDAFEIRMQAIGAGGAANSTGLGGSGTGGTGQVVLANGASLTTVDPGADPFGSAMIVAANGFGGASLGQSGDGIGGNVSLALAGSTLSLDAADLVADGRSPDGAAVGGLGQAGRASAIFDQSAATIGAFNLFVRASGGVGTTSSGAAEYGDLLLDLVDSELAGDSLLMASEGDVPRLFEGAGGLEPARTRVRLADSSIDLTGSAGIFGSDDVAVEVSGAGGLSAVQNVEIFARDDANSLIRVDQTGSAGNAAIAADRIAMTAGNIEIAGLLQAGSELFLGAIDRILVFTPSGALRVLDGDGRPAGNLTLQADDIWVATPTILDQLLDDPDFAGRNEALTDNGGLDAPRGFVEADSVAFLVGNSLLVQNGATPDDPAGITVGSGLSIGASGDDPVDVFAFARRLNDDGSFTGNNDLFADVVIDPAPVAFTPTSSLGDCLFVSGCPIAPPPPPPVRPSLPFPADVAQGPPAEEQKEDDSDERDASQGLVDTSSLPDEWLIEEPVTSGSDSLLWATEGSEAEEEEEEEEAAAPAPGERR